jgi:mRNA-degrading endonuclease toxin of MazEF toxin-antitoxin module
VDSDSVASPSPRLRQGSIYWLYNCAPLDDENFKDRPVVIVDDPESLKTGEYVVVVACSTKNRKNEYDSVKLPDRGSMPQTRSGLPKACWAIPRWYFPVHRSRLVEYKGHLTGGVLKAVILAYSLRSFGPDGTSAHSND